MRLNNELKNLPLTRFTLSLIYISAGVFFFFTLRVMAAGTPASRITAERDSGLTAEETCHDEQGAAKVRTALLARTGFPRTLTRELEQNGSRALGHTLIALGSDPDIQNNLSGWERILLSLNHPSTLEGFVDMLEDTNVIRRVLAINILSKMTDGRAYPALERRIRKAPATEPARRCEWAIILSWPFEEALWREHLKHADPLFRYTAARALARNGSLEAIKDLRVVASDSDKLVQSGVRDAIRAIRERNKRPVWRYKPLIPRRPESPPEPYSYTSRGTVTADNTQFVMDVLHKEGWTKTRWTIKPYTIYTFVRVCLLACTVDTGEWRIAFRKDFRKPPSSFQVVYATATEALVAELHPSHAVCYWVDLETGQQRKANLDIELWPFNYDRVRDHVRALNRENNTGVHLIGAHARWVNLYLSSYPWSPDKLPAARNILYRFAVDWRTWR